MGLSLGAMAKIGTEKLAIYKVSATDGRAFIQSDPVGASIILITEEGRKDTGKKTPSLIELPKGVQNIELVAKGFKVGKLTININGTIAKPGKVTLEPLTVPIDVIFEPGWQVFVDGKLVKAIGSDKAETPCTVELPLGRHEIGLAKDGFMDIKQQVEIKEDGIDRKAMEKSLAAIRKIKLESKESFQKDSLIHTIKKGTVIVHENMGYAIASLKTGVSSHTNWNGPWISIPKELAGKQFTQIVANSVTPVTLEFQFPAKVWVLLNKSVPSIYPMALKVVQKLGATKEKEVLINPTSTFEVWTINGMPNQKIEFPTQIGIVADEIILNP